MSLHLRDSDINEFYRYQEDIKSLCREFLTKHNIVFFGFVRCYEDKSCLILTTHPELFHLLLETELPLTSPVPHVLLKKKTIYYAVPPCENYADALDIVAKHFNLFRPFDFITRYVGYYEAFCYGIDKDNPEMTNYYINYLDEFKMFNESFKKNTRQILLCLEQKKIFLPDSVFSPVSIFIYPTATVSNAMKINKRKYFDVKVDKLTISLTKREYDCLKHLVKGKTAKQTAQELSLSYRTVESYLDNIRDKTLCRSKIELFSKIDYFEFN